MKSIGLKIWGLLSSVFRAGKGGSPSVSMAVSFPISATGYKKESKPVAKYFKDSEIEGLDPKLVEMLDKAREAANTPIVITSGLRSASSNEAAGGVDGSAHTKGLAVDIRAPNDEYGKQVAYGLGVAGFKRVGFYDKHLHADIDPDKPTPAVWWGKSK